MSFFSPLSSDFLTFKISKHIKINLLFAILLLFSIFGGFYTEFILSYISALLHETGHIFAARRFNIGISCIDIKPFGVCARLKSEIIKRPTVEIFVAICGPFVNIILCIIAYIFKSRIPYNIFKYTILCNALMAAINILPALPLDGGRILRAILSKNLSSVKAYNASFKISRIIVAALFVFSVAMLLCNSFNFSLILISAFLLGNLFSEQHNVTKAAIRETTNYKEKIKQGGYNSACVIIASEAEPARKILKYLTFSKYHIVCVSDDNLTINKILTEGEILDALFKRGIRLTLGEI